MRTLLLLFVAGGLALGVIAVIAWQTGTFNLDPVRHAGGTTGGGDVYTHAEDAAACIEQARAFTGYPLLFAGPSVLGYPLTGCQHMRTETRYDPQGRVASPGQDVFHFDYGTCTIPEGRENCQIPVGISINPCALTVGGRVIPRASQSMGRVSVRGAQADINTDGELIFELSPHIIGIGAPGGSPTERTANGTAIAEALIPANALASALPPAALLATTLGALTVACP
jgi:hypothetical protein